MRKTVMAAVAALTLASTGVAFAQPTSWDLTRREAWLQQRIDRGRDDGSLAPDEARRVQRELDRIRADQDRMRVDGGGLREADRDALEARLDDLSDHIHWLKANNEERPWAHPEG
jgi:hypothetical protein